MGSIFEKLCGFIDYKKNKKKFFQKAKREKEREKLHLLGAVLDTETLSVKTQDSL